MKTVLLVVFTAAALSLQARTKAPSQYFRKDFPAPKPGSPQQQPPQQPRANGTPPPPPAQAVRPKFKDVVTNSQFYFLTDTNRAYPWTKISATVATNAKTGAKQSFSPEVPVQR